MTGNANNKWTKTCIALGELLELLRCSKCKKSLHDPQQHLKCGHFACTSCVSKSNNTCIDCILHSKNKDFMNDDVVKKIVQVCCTIVEEIGCESEKVDSNAGDKVKPEEMPLNNIKNKVPIQDANVENKSAVLISTKKLSKKLGKQKRSAPHSNNNDPKKPRLERFKTILNNPQKINKRYLPKGETMLHQECSRNNIDIVKAFLDAGADPNISCNAGWTPLQESVAFNFYEIAEMLLRSGADVDKKGCDDSTALHEATKKNNLKMIHLLLKYKAKKDICDGNGKVPMHYCTSDEAKDLLHVEIESELQNSNNTKDENSTENKNTLVEDNDERSSTSNRITCNSNLLENQKDGDINLGSSIKEEDNASEELAIVYEKISSINLRADPLKKSISYHVFPPSPGKENYSTKANCNLSVNTETKSKLANEDDNFSNNVLKCNEFHESINLLSSQNSNILNAQNDDANCSQNSENSRVTLDSDEIIDVVN